MTYFVYLIGNYRRLKLTTYVGYTQNLKKRIGLHNNGKGAKFTRGRQWKIIYTEKYKEEKIAKVREYYIKKNRKFRKRSKYFAWKKLNYSSNRTLR